MSALSKWTVGLLVALGASLSIASVSAEESGQATDAQLPAGARIDRLVAYKSAHRLEAWSGETRLATYRIAIGAGGAGPKRFEGDRRTPEGTYRIDRRHRSRLFHRFLHVSYPNAEDRRRYRRLQAEGAVPEGRGIGSAIGIHGESRDPEVRALGRSVDWTDGCIAVSDAEIEALYEAVIPNAVLEIHP